MKIFRNLFTMSVSVVLFTSVVGMEKDRMVKFMGDFSVVSMEESDVSFMKTLHKHYQDHKSAVNAQSIIPRYKYVPSHAIALVCDALKVRPDQFKNYYNKLSNKDRTLLIESSGQYSAEGKKVMLDVPEITTRLIDVYFTDDGLRNYIKKYIGTEGQDYVRAYFKERLIRGKSTLTLKQPKLYDYGAPIREHMYVGSCFIDAINTVEQHKYPIPLRTGDTVRQAYTTYFGIDNYEYRITDLADKQCLLWVINHDDLNDTFSTLIQHKRPIKGCRFGSTGTDVEYVVTYSKHDIILSTITTQNGIAFVDSITINAPEQSSIVDVCFDPVKGDWVVGLYKGRKSIIKRLNKEGCWDVRGTSFSCKRWGLLAKIVSYQQNDECFVDLIFKVSNYFKIVKCKELGTTHCSCIESTDLVHCRDGKQPYAGSFGRVEFVDLNGSLCMFDYTCPFFTESREFQQNNQQGVSFLNNMWDYFSSKPMSKIHRVYSPDGSFLMCNSLKNKLGVLYVETIIKDALTHKVVLSIDTVYKNFRGVGFTHSGTELIFISCAGPHYVVSLLNDDDKKILQEVETLAFDNLGVTSLLKRLCEECRKNGVVSLSADDSTYAMLLEWSKKSPLMLEFLKKCLPIQRIKK